MHEITSCFKRAFHCLHRNGGITYLHCMNDRNLGYSVILFSVISVLIVSIYLSSQFLTPVYHRTILFDSVNTLSFLKKEPCMYPGH